MKKTRSRKSRDTVSLNVEGNEMGMVANNKYLYGTVVTDLLYFFYVLLPYIIYVMPSGHFSHCPPFISQTAKERDKKYSVKSPQR
jgi:hypothetical protein